MLTQFRGGQLETSYFNLTRKKNSPTIAALQFSSKAASIGVMLMGWVVLIGWIFDISTLKSIWPELVTMKANTAICFILSGLSLWNLRRYRWGWMDRADRRERPPNMRKMKRGLQSCLFHISWAIVLLIGGLTLIEYGWDINLGIDQLLFQETANAVGTSDPGRMAPNTAFNFVLLSCAIVLSDKKLYRIAQGASAIGFLIGFLGLLGYLYGISAFYGLGKSTEMALHTSGSFILLALGILLAHPDRGVMAIVTNDRAGGVAARRLLLAAIVIPPALGAAILQGYRSQLYDEAVGIALLGILNTIVLTLVILWNAKTIGAIDAQREQAERERYLSAIAAARTEELQLTLQDLQKSQAQQQQVQAALRQAEQQYRSIFENAVEGIFQSTLDGHYLTVNPMLAQIYGYNSPQELIATLTNIERQLYVDKNRRAEFVRLLQKSDAFWNFESQVYRKDGSIIWISENARVIRNDRGKIIGYEGTVEDISQRKQAEENLEQSLSLLRATLESTADGILAIDCAGTIATYNQKLIDLLQIPESLLTCADLNLRLQYLMAQLTNPEEFLHTIQDLLDRPEAEARDLLTFKDGRILERYSRPQWIGDEIVGRVFSFRDITDRIRAEQKIRYQAFHDSLTHLPNRILLNDRLSSALERARETHSKVAVMFLDLDRFKTINDTLGHAVGDKLLQSVATRLKGCLREDDIIARWGGDEFTAILPQIASVTSATTIAERIIDILKPAFHIDGNELHITTSIGISLYPRDGEDGETLIKNADAALYQGKERGRNTYQIYNPEMSLQAGELLNLENRLHLALEREEFRVYYQPKVDISTWKTTGFEALVRWEHPELGLVSPAKFIPLAEENGLIVPIGEWVLKTACAQTKAWIDAGLAAVPVAVNLSVRQFQQPDLVEKVARILADTRLAPQFLKLEITETTAMLDVDFTRNTLTELATMGVEIALDDFGTGYSSLNYLKQFPLHTLKIDRSFVRDLTVDRADIAIARAVIALGQGLNLRVVAEGVECQAQLDCLRSLRCDEIQGYFFSPPLTPEAATQLLLESPLPQALPTGEKR